MSHKNILTRSKAVKAEALFRENRLPEAKELYASLVQINRTDPAVWLMLGIINRKLKSFKESEECCRRAVTLKPDYAAAHQGLGAALQCLGRMDKALAAYRTAIRLDPVSAEAHYLLANALKDLGMVREAIEHYRKAVELHPDYLEALSNLGAALIALNMHEEAQNHLLRALRLRPQAPQILCNMALLHQQEGRFEEARDHCRLALQYAPDFVDAIAIMAALHEKWNQHEEAGTMVRRGLALDPDNVSLNITAAKLVRHEGRTEDSIAQLETFRAKIPETLQGDLLLLLGQLYDKKKDTARAFHCLSEGNRIKAAGMLGGADDSEQYLQRIVQLRQRFRAEDPRSWTSFAEDDFSDNPIFLLGFPRSGTTLLEQILDSHPRLQAIDERPTISAVDHAFQQISIGRDRPFAELTMNDIRRLRQAYFDTAARYIKRDPARILVDKMPLNTVEAALIWRVFPKAKIILAIRHPCDACFSCFMQNFALNRAMNTFFSLEKTAEAYAGVMSLWQEYIAALPIDYHRIRYEDLVADQAGVTARLLEFLGLEWDESVLRHDERARQRRITTPSYHQVTQPIYQDAKYRWKRYEEYMKPVLPILQPYIDYFGYAETKK